MTRRGAFIPRRFKSRNTSDQLSVDGPITARHRNHHLAAITERRKDHQQDGLFLLQTRFDVDAAHK